VQETLLRVNNMLMAVVVDFRLTSPVTTSTADMNVTVYSASQSQRGTDYSV